MLLAVAGGNAVLTLILLLLIFKLRANFAAAVEASAAPLAARIEATQNALIDKFGLATTDMAQRLERAKGDLRQETSDRLNAGFADVRNSVEKHLFDGRAEQSKALTDTAGRLDAKFSDLQKSTEEKLDLFADRQVRSLAQARQELRDSLGQTADALNVALARVEKNQADALAQSRTELNRTLLTTTDLMKQEMAALSKRMGDGLETIRADTEKRLGSFGDGQTRALAEARKELTESLDRSGVAIKQELTGLIGQTRQSLEGIRGEVDRKLIAISDQVTSKLDQNIKEGFKQFEKVQEHLKAAEEQLRNVSMVGSSINDLNNLLKLPHLRGRFGEASLERLLEDFLPAHMYALQASPGKGGHGRADAVIRFPERDMPIDAKFPREQILPLFECNDPAQLAQARDQFCRVIKEQAKRIGDYIHPENGTTDMALMYLPSETLYMEALLNGELSEWLNKQRIFPVSPNTLIVTLQSIQMVFKMYEFAKSYERATEELRKAQTAFGYFEKQFDNIGSSLGKAQQAYEVARGHLNKYRNRVVNLTGEEPPELANGSGGALEGK